MSLETILEPLPDVRFRAVGGEGVVVRQDAAEVLVLNGVAVRVLELLDGARTVDGVIDALEGEYAAGRTQIANDVLGYLDDLLTAGVIRPRAA